MSLSVKEVRYLSQLKECVFVCFNEKVREEGMGVVRRRQINGVRDGGVDPLLGHCLPGVCGLITELPML